MRTTIILPAAVTVVAAALLAGCATSSDVPSPVVESASVLGVWVLDEDFDTAPQTPYLAFAGDDSWQGSDGCNTVTGTWSVEDDGTLTVTAGPSTLIACDGAPLPTILSTATHLTVDGGTLVLTGPDGDTVLTITTDPDVGPQDPVGVWGEPDDEGQPSLELTDDGALIGNDGCNELVGEWSDEDGQLVFSGVAQTLMACEDVDTWLSAASYAYLQAGVMIVYSEDGTLIGQLARN